MLNQKAPNTAGTTLSITTTATAFFDLVNTAAGTDLSLAGYDSGVNGVDITLEDGNIRYLYDGNTPTSTQGLLGRKGEILHLRHKALEKFQLIAIDDAVKCSQVVGICERSESDSISAASGAIPVADFFLEIGKRNIPGTQPITQYGENPDIDAGGGFEFIWDAGGTYVPPTIARIHDIVSDNAADAGILVTSGTATGGGIVFLDDTSATFITDGVAPADVVLNDTNLTVGVVTVVVSETRLQMGLIREPQAGIIGEPTVSGDAYRVVTNGLTGTGIVFLTGLNDSFLITSEFVITNGLTVVPTLNSYARIFRMRAFGANTTGAVGTVTATAQVDGTITAQIVDGNNQALMAIFTVPFGKVAFVYKWFASMSKKTSGVSTVRLRGGTLDGIGYISQTRAITSDGTSDLIHEFTTPFAVGPGADIWVEADSSANNVGVSAGFELILVDDV